jgi:5-methylcytosine-specific restriction endonuclease McrA
VSELSARVRLRASNRCEYCWIPEAALREVFHIEHVIPRQHGGQTELANLAWACAKCNRKKGPNLAGIDPTSGLIIPLFDPRRQTWSDHFALSEPSNGRIDIYGITPVGRVTAQVLGMNEESRRTLRYKLRLELKS